VHTIKDDVHALLAKLLDDCTLEDVQYHLYVLGKIRRDIERTESEGTISQEEVERRLAPTFLP
jgi:hypothetical protein